MTDAYGQRLGERMLLVDRDLRVSTVPGAFATGDATRAASDEIGNYALTSCQHATRMGAFAGNNAGAELLGVPTKPYHQEAYATCLDLGEAGAIFTRGWDRKLELVGAEAKKTKQEINAAWIFPPRAERAAALASADPEHVTELQVSRAVPIAARKLRKLQSEQRVMHLMVRPWQTSR